LAVHSGVGLINTRLIERAAKAAFLGQSKALMAAWAALSVDKPVVVLRLVPA
jgi:hypothetical protein